MLSDLSVKDLLNKTASSSPVPGGGSIAALSASIAAALSEMVANLTIGKKGFENVEPEMKKIAAESSRLRDKLVKDVDRDSDAFNDVLAAFRLPKNNEEEKMNRSKAIQDALKNAAMVPLSVARDASKVMDLAEIVIKKGNKNAVTDGAVGAMTARTAVLGALYNVKINLGSIKDIDFVKEVTKDVRKLETEVINKERKILSEVNL